uniref:Uncharacterized protein n=1 Tax=Anguilla anguilla TaxID=7936 RepID=A0A0E9VV60_ANGAN
MKQVYFMVLFSERRYSQNQFYISKHHENTVA